MILLRSAVEIFRALQCLPGPWNGAPVVWNHHVEKEDVEIVAVRGLQFFDVHALHRIFHAMHLHVHCLVLAPND